MTFRQPLIYRWRQQKPRLTIHLAKIAHPPTAHGAPTKQPYPHYGLTPPKSDRLLDGAVATEAAALHDDLELPRLPPFPPELLAAVDLVGGDLATIRNILAAYHRTNGALRPAR